MSEARPAAAGILWSCWLSDMSILLDAGCCCEDDDPKPGEGTCCLPGDICAKGFSQIGCESVGGVYLGDDAECDNLPAGVCGTAATCTDPPLDCQPVSPSCVQFDISIGVVHLDFNRQFPDHPCNDVIGQSCTSTVNVYSGPSIGCGYAVIGDACPIVDFLCDPACCCEVFSGNSSCVGLRIQETDVICLPNGGFFDPLPHWQGTTVAKSRTLIFTKNIGNGPGGSYAWRGCIKFGDHVPPEDCGSLEGPLWDFTNVSFSVSAPGSCPVLAPPPIMGRHPFLFDDDR